MEYARGDVKEARVNGRGMHNNNLAYRTTGRGSNRKGCQTRVAPWSEIPCEWRKARRVHTDHIAPRVRGFSQLAREQRVYFRVHRMRRLYVRVIGFVRIPRENFVRFEHIGNSAPNNKLNKICVCRKHWNCFVNYSENLGNYNFSRDIRTIMFLLKH